MSQPPKKRTTSADLYPPREPREKTPRKTGYIKSDSLWKLLAYIVMIHVGIIVATILLVLIFTSVPTGFAFILGGSWGVLAAIGLDIIVLCFGCGPAYMGSNHHGSPW